MVIPPTFSDLGRSASDLFSKGFHNNVVKLEFKTKTQNGLEYKTTGTFNQESKAVTGNLETKLNVPKHGMTVTETWNTDNVLGGKIDIEDHIANGFKITCDTSFSIITGKKSFKLKSLFKRDLINTSVEFVVDQANPSINANTVGLYNGWLVGLDTTFDTHKSIFNKAVLALGYKGSDFDLHTYVKDGTNFGGSIYHKVSPDLETAVNLAWTSSSTSKGTQFGLAAKYCMDKDSFISFKVDNESAVGIGYTHTLRPGVKLTLSSMLDGKAIAGGDHKLGLGLEFNP